MTLNVMQGRQMTIWHRMKSNVHIFQKSNTQQVPTYQCCRNERTHFLNRVSGDNRKIILPKHRNESRLDVG